MVSIIKNQLLKHLSRYTKNLREDQINLSAFKGEGDLANLELDELVLTDLLELPSWLRLTSARCNRVNFRIQWTKLKSVPIFLTLDEVQIEVETCEDLRSMSVQGGLSAMGGGRYSFIHKVIDGMTVAVNTVHVTFRSPAFVASLQISRIMVESKCPQWTRRGDIRATRLKDPEKGQLLIFKELEWQTVRIEARSTQDTNLTPLRLLTNQARCRIVIKKRISDCFVMGSRLLLILDDLLWVLTDSQLRAALHFLNSLSGLVQKATEVTRKKKAARKLEVLPEYQAQISQQARKQGRESDLSRIFSRYDVVETSYHFLSQHIDLHLCDDPGVGRSCHPDLQDGGALQISLQGFQVDYYPYHLAIGDRKHWPKYKEAASSHTQWLQQALTSFKNSFLDLIEGNRSLHTPLSRSAMADFVAEPVKSNGAAFGVQSNDSGSQEQENGRRASHAQNVQSNPVKSYVVSQLAKLMTSCVILRIEDFTLFRVTTPKRKQMPKDFISGDKDRYSLPGDIRTVHAEFTYYYYPGDIPFPLPPPKFYVQLNPIQVYFDVLSVLWANSFALNLHQSLQKSVTEMNSSLPYVDVKIEAVMPRIIMESSTEHLSQRDRPKSLHIQASRVTVTNVRSTQDSCSRADLAKCVHTFQLGSLFFGSDFPSKPGEYHVVNKKFISHLEASDNIRPAPTHIVGSSVQDIVSQLCRELLWVEAKDTWCIHLDPVWGEFYGTRAVGSNRATSFFDALPITVWAYMKPAQPNMEDSSVKSDLQSQKTSLEPGTADIHLLLQVSNLMSVQINHYQLLFLLRLAEEGAEAATFLTMDTSRILDQKSGGSLVVGAFLPQVEVTLVMPSQTPGKESSGGDVESVFPDSSSLGDELVGSNVERSTDLGSGNVDRASVHFSTSTGHVSQDTRIKRGEHQMATNSNGRATPGSDVSSSYSMDFQMRQTSRQYEEKPVASAVPSTFNNFRKGFSKVTNFIDAALKPSDDASDTASLRSEGSSDSENYVMIGGESSGIDRPFDASDAMFRVTSYPDNNLQKVELACEVLEEEPTGTIVTTPSERADSIDSSIKRRDLVSVVTFKLAKVEFVQQSEGFSSIIKVQVANVTSDECGAIPWDEFQSKFSSRSRAWVEMPLDTAGHPRIQLRLDHNLLPEFQSVSESLKGPWDRSCMQSWFNDLLVVYVTDLPIRLTMSSVTGLVDLVEDEIIPLPLPMEVHLENVSLHLVEDRPSNNITSPGPVPIDASISRLHISRDRSGLFLIEPPGRARADESAELERLERSLSRVTSENEELRRRLTTFEQLSEENHRLRRSAEESDALRSCLANAQEELNSLLEVKESLLYEMQALRQKVNRSGSSGSMTSSGKR
ncbi:UHRF1-binding protein 1-like [Frankliniella fusca]|uniref:UHRF1-binding protein 1-like n=1 Tax=Frankliniella fusca TaxID=407009 RepID=A0AAE1HKU9_9NEOP|nr:UHRF1-binding protein 1-like [Frankliniella fusca]